MYDQFYGLQGRPFQLTPDPHFYFESATHRKALSYLGYGLAQGEGFIVITGDIGAGKTTLVGHLMSTIDPMRLTAVKIVSTQVEGDDMLRLAAQSFGVAVDGAPKAQLLQRIESFLHAQARAGRRSLLIVDEAQNLPVSALEELRMLSNFQLGGQSLLQIFLLGQPEFRDLLKSPALEQLRQRVIATHHLEPMMPHEVEPYILHRLSLVGWTGNPRFTPEAFAAIYAASAGVPRRVNALASRVLLMGAIDQLTVIDAAVVDAVVADMGIDNDARPEPVAPSVLDSVDEPDLPGADLPSYDPSSRWAADPLEQADPPALAEPEWNPSEPDVAGMSDAVRQHIAGQREDTARAWDDEDSVAREAMGFAAPAADVAAEVDMPVFGDVPAQVDAGIDAIREDIADLHAEAVPAESASATAPPIDAEVLDKRLALIEDRLVGLEFRAREQDAALRRVLTLLVDWVEREERMRDQPHDAAA